MKQLLEAGVHFGHQISHWNPKMKDFIFGSRNGIHIIDLQQTVGLFKRSYDYARDVVANGGDILFVGTKKQAQGIIAEEALFTSKIAEACIEGKHIYEEKLQSGEVEVKEEDKSQVVVERKVFVFKDFGEEGEKEGAESVAVSESSPGEAQAASAFTSAQDNQTAAEESASETQTSAATEQEAAATTSESAETSSEATETNTEPEDTKED